MKCTVNTTQLDALVSLLLHCGSGFLLAPLGLQVTERPIHHMNLHSSFCAAVCVSPV